ncbi:MAG: hypothetical protein SPL19_04315 [Fibrobacter sp.]|nr:hypothetical protein [Fibrobacter sp.]MDY6370081.1 hypothetical protein [Fibrobacter sp.]MDY6389564.1 hypothetical protein [Fibrobacter sp.]
MKKLFLLLALLFIACSEYPDMEPDILAQHIYSQNPIELGSSNKEYVKMLAKSFGMSEKEIVAVQKHILSKKTTGKMKDDFERALEKKVFELKQRHRKPAQKDFVVNVLAPYFDALSRNQIYKSGMENEIFEHSVCELYEKFFPGDSAAQSLAAFMNASRIYFSGESFNVDYLNTINRNLLKYGLFLDYELQSMANLLKVQDTLLPMTAYKGDSLAAIKLKRFIPGLMPSKVGYYTIGMRYVVILEDMVAVRAEADLLELEKGEFFRKYGDKRFERFWRYLGLDMTLEKASEIYNRLLKKDFGGKSIAYIKRAEELNTTIHETKHIVDQIEHPELTLNLDAEFSAHVTEAIFSPVPNVALFSAIQRMENYAMVQREPYLNQVVVMLWNMAERSAYEEQYTNDSLQVDLLNLYNNYRTIREKAYFEPLDEFADKIVSKL